MSNSIDTPMTGTAESKTGYDGGGGAGNQVRSLISVNDLTYVLEPDLSCAVNRTHKRHFFQSNEYRYTQNAICILNSGADYIDPRRSFLEFEISLPDDLAVGYFGRAGSVANLIRQVTISTRSGDEISRIADYAHFMNMMMPYQFDEEWFTQHGEMMGWQGCIYGKRVHVGINPVSRAYHDSQQSEQSRRLEGLLSKPGGPDADGFVQLPFNKTNLRGGVSAKNTFTDRRFCIPIYLLSPFFQYNRLLPAMIMSGLRIEIEWSNPVKAFVQCKQYVEDVTKYKYKSPNQFKVDDVEYKDDNADYKNAEAKMEAIHNPGENDLDERTGTKSTFIRPTPDAISSYTIHKPIFNLCSVQLSDAVQRALNELSAINGLEIVYCDYEKTEAHLGSSENSSTSAYIEVRKSCSRALKAYARVYDTLRDSSVDDSLRGDDFPILEYQWQLGSLYFPNQSVKTNREGVNSAYSVAPLAFTYFLDSMDKYHPASRSSYGPYHRTYDVRSKAIEEHGSIYGGFCGNKRTNANATLEGIGTCSLRWDPKYATTRLVPTPLAGPNENFMETAYKDCTDMHYGQIGTYARDQHVLGVSLERSTLFNLAGVPVNNSRVLALRMRLWQPSNGENFEILSYRCDRAGDDSNQTGAVIYVGRSDEATGGVVGQKHHRGRRCMIYLKFVKLARVFLNNVEVEQ